MTDLAYVGQELTIFAHATNWKSYYSRLIRPYFGKKVLEVGAGLGATTVVMCDGSQSEWVCLEPDAVMRAEIDALIAAGRLPACCRSEGGFVGTLPAGELFDTLVYIDVLEHIEDDRAELAAAAAHLAPGGALVVLSPAHNFLYSPFDKSIGHWRRYNKRMLREITPPVLRIEKLIYLDSVGMLTSLVNRFLLKQSMPKVEQILFWDRTLLPFARLFDPLTGYLTGRSIVGVWRKA
jgi:SAM-dependent methyltransferase